MRQVQPAPIEAWLAEELSENLNQGGQWLRSLSLPCPPLFFLTPIQVGLACIYGCPLYLLVKESGANRLILDMKWKLIAGARANHR
jgi:hypothetical protein